MLELFSNGPGGKDITINFFYKNSSGVVSAQLACPFFTDINPIKILKENGCRQINLLVRLCEVTSPEALERVRKYDGINIRFYTSRVFHAKFYILNQVALVGSANLTDAGLNSNRELSLLIDSSQEVFDEIPALFDELWAGASVLTEDSLKKFKTWKSKNPSPRLPDISGIDLVSPRNINVATHVESGVRSYLESFRSLYVEKLLPSYNIVEKLYEAHGNRHPNFEGHLKEYEIDRFLFWVRGFTTDEKLYSHPIRQGDDLNANIKHYIGEWFNIEGSELSIDLERLNRISVLKKIFTDEASLDSIDLNELVEALQGCAAFVEMRRFTRGGLENHLDAFKRDNSLEDIKRSFHHLAFGSGDYVQRIYDCIFSPEYKLRHWGRNCVFELFGWINNQEVPPLNGRILKAMRFLGFDVQA